MKRPNWQEGTLVIVQVFKAKYITVNIQRLLLKIELLNLLKNIPYKLNFTSIEDRNTYI